MEGRVVRSQGSVHLIGRYMVEAVRGDGLLVDPQRLRRFEQRMGADDVGADEVIGTQDRAIHVRLRGEMHQGVDAMLLEQLRAPVDSSQMSPFTKTIPRILVQAREVVDVAGIGECIEHHHPPLPGLRQPVAHEVRADEAGAAGNEQVTGFEAHRAWSLNCAANAAPARQ